MTTTTAEPLTYEYRSFPVNPKRLSLARDTYANFGWVPDDPATSVSSSRQLSLRLKRDRHIKGHDVITELQTRAENALADIDKLERQRTAKATAIALGIGIVGCALMAGAVFTFTASIWEAFVILGVLGIACWLAAYPVYKNIHTYTSTVTTPLIDEQYNTIDQACEQAHQILS